MADGLNKVMLLGNLTRDGDLKSTQSGEAVLSFTVACSESYKARDGERKESTQFIPCVLWGKRASALAQYLTKGARVYVEGTFTTRSWEKDGTKQYKTEVRVLNVILCGGRSEGGGRRTDRDAEPVSDAQSDAPYDAPGDDDIPF